METGSWKPAPFIPYPKAGWRPDEGEGDERVENKGLKGLKNSRTHFGVRVHFFAPGEVFTELGFGTAPSKPKRSQYAKFTSRLESRRERLSFLPRSPRSPSEGL